MPNEKGERVLGDCWKILERHGIKVRSGYDRFDAFQLADAVEKLERQNAKLIEALKASMHALRSYQYGNSATELAEEMADTCEKLLRESGAIQ